LLRANFLRDTGRRTEARRLYEAILDLPEDQVPECVRHESGLMVAGR
jgi:hypothetical protein